MTGNVIKRHKGMLPSPVVGMDLGHWLAIARTTETELECVLARPDLEVLQREKIIILLRKVRNLLSVQLERINAPQPFHP
jgi:hypothetical protein